MRKHSHEDIYTKWEFFLFNFIDIIRFVTNTVWIVENLQLESFILKYSKYLNDKQNSLDG